MNILENVQGGRKCFGKTSETRMSLKRAHLFLYLPILWFSLGSISGVGPEAWHVGNLLTKPLESDKENLDFGCVPWMEAFHRFLFNNTHCANNWLFPQLPNERQCG